KTAFEGALRGFNASWSPDSRYLAYAKEQDNRNTAIAIFDVKEQRLRQVTSGFYNDNQPVFDPDGKYLFFTTNRTFDPIYSDFDNSWVYPNATKVVTVPLLADTPSPLAPKNDEASIKEEEKKEEPKG